MATTNAKSPPDELELLDEELELEDEELLDDDEELLEDDELLEEDELLEGVVVLLPPPQPASAAEANARPSQ